MKEEQPLKPAPLYSLAHNLFEKQMVDWVQCRESYECLAHAEIQEVPVDRVHFKKQWNPGRLSSTSAKVDPTSIAERRCFLCDENRPDEQLSVSYGEYKMLINPFPIFPEHLTIVNKRHRPQSIKENFSAMLQLSVALGDDFVVLYNGPACGASAPDHLHFQAGNKNSLPLTGELADAKKKSTVHAHLDWSTTLYFPEDGVRRFIVIEGANANSIQDGFTLVYDTFARLLGNGAEPMMNVLAYYDTVGHMHRIVIFPRSKHRTSEYYAEGAKQLLLSPGSIDMGGLCILPRKEDFDKITPAMIRHIIADVCLSDDDFKNLYNEISLAL